MGEKVTVLMPVHNGQAFLAEAVASILSQSFKDFDFLIVDDGSTDRTPAILASFSDPRIRVLRNPVNRGLVESLNRGIDACDGKYIARMDSDDVAFPERLETQVGFMESHDEIVASGSWYRVLGTKTIEQKPIAHADIVLKLLEGTPIGHPTAIIRGDILRKVMYSPDYPHAEDYKLWSDLSRIGKLANIPQALLDYRIHELQITSKDTRLQGESSDRIRLEQLKDLGLKEIESRAADHLRLMKGEDADPAAILDWVSRLLDANRRAATFPEPAFTEFILKKFADNLDDERGLSLARIATRRAKRAWRNRHGS